VAKALSVETELSHLRERVADLERRLSALERQKA
jgi:polyhydroxyalkanoate synthesis regulator phasin